LKLFFVIPKNYEVGLGKVTLPGKYFQEIAEQGNAWGMAFSLFPSCGYMGVILSKKPLPPALFIEVFSRIYQLLVCSIWLLAGISLLFLGKPPTLGVRAELTLWFLEIIISPVILILSAGYRLQSDLDSNMKAALQRDLSESVRKTETGSVRVNEKFFRLCEKLSQNPTLNCLLEKSRTEKKLQTKIKDKIWETCTKKGLDLSGLIIYGMNEFEIIRLHPDYNPDLASVTVQYFRFLSRSILQLQSSDQSETVLSEFLRKNNLFFGTHDQLFQVKIREKHTRFYYNIVFSSGKPKFVVYFILNQEAYCQRYFREAIPNAFRENPTFFFAAFKQVSTSFQLVADAGNPLGVGYMVKIIKERDNIDEQEGVCLVPFKSKNNPGYYSSLENCRKVLDFFPDGFALSCCLSIFCGFQSVCGLFENS